MEHYLCGLAENDNGFTFKVAQDDCGERCGYVWMTSIQHRSFELYGHQLFLDAMWQQQNSVSWPYFGPVVINGDKGNETVCEAILCTESIDAYSFLLQSLFKMAPGRS